MAAQLENITEEKFNKLNWPILFNDETTSRCFGIISNGEQNFRLAWQSDLIQPVITEIRSSIYGVGIDQDYAIVNFATNTVELKLNLTYNFFCASVFGEILFIVTELEVVKLNVVTFEVVQYYGLPSHCEEIIVRDSGLEIKCEDLIVKIPIG
jgi:hypothetical protein